LRNKWDKRILYKRSNISQFASPRIVMQEIYAAAEGRRESRRSPPADYQYVMIIDMATLSAILPSRTDGGRVRYESAKLPRRVNKADVGEVLFR
jgi:hypothetical protein